MGEIENKAEEFAGNAKQAVGAVTGNDSLQSEGKMQEEKAEAKDAVEDATE